MIQTFYPPFLGSSSVSLTIRRSSSNSALCFLQNGWKKANRKQPSGQMQIIVNHLWFGSPNEFLSPNDALDDLEASRIQVALLEPKHLPKLHRIFDSLPSGLLATPLMIPGTLMVKVNRSTTIRGEQFNGFLHFMRH